MKRSNESIVRVQTAEGQSGSGNAPRAGRLTLAGIRALHKREIHLAEKKFREAIRADFSYGPAHSNLGLMHYEQGNLYQAVIAFEQARELLPNDPSVLYNLALALESAGRTDEALDLYYQANEMDPVNPIFLGNLVRLKIKLGERDEFLQHQLRELVLIETRPDWRRWADRQLGLNLNLSLDRGPATPDLESTVRDSRERDDSEFESKIIDLTPVMPTSPTQPNNQLRGQLVPEPVVPEPSIQDPTPTGSDSSSMESLLEQPAMDLLPPMTRPTTDALPGESVLQEQYVEDLSIEDGSRR
ncbi:MAG: tetratricopeptide repeat protein [Planctomycetota bacterium]